MTHDPLAPISDIIREETTFFLRLVMFVAFCALAALALGAFAAPRAGGPEECAVIGDIGITARALAEEGLAQDSARRILDRMYPAALAAKWADPILRIAYTDKRSARQFANDLGSACMQRMGDVDGFLGVNA